MKAIYQTEHGTIWTVRKTPLGKYRAYKKICRGGRRSSNWVPLRQLYEWDTEEQAQEELDEYADKHGARFLADKEGQQWKF